MSFCRITGKSRGLPKPNYFPLLPPISPADAKRLCRITNKSQGLPSHHYIPALSGAITARANCKVTGKAKGQGPHHYPNVDGISKPHTLIPGYRYVFPKFDEDQKNQKNLINLMSLKAGPGDSDVRYVYSVEEKKTNLVIPAGLEAAVRDGEVRDVMLDNEGDTILIKMYQGPSVTVGVKNFIPEEGVVMWEGSGPSEAVLLQREKEEQENEERKAKRLEAIKAKKKVFEDKEKAFDEEELEMMNRQEMKKAKLSKRESLKENHVGGFTTFNEKLFSSLSNEKKEPIFGHIVHTSSSVTFFPGTSVVDLPEGKIIPGRMVHHKDGIKFVPGIILDGEFIPGQMVVTNKGEEFVPGQVIETCEGPKFVPGQVAETSSGPKFVPGQTIETENGPQFVPGQIIETKAGPTFIPGQIIVTDNQAKFVPGRVIETVDGPRFVPGRVIETGDQVTFVSGQVVETPDGLKFIAPDLENSIDGAQEFSVQGFEVTPEELKLLRPTTGHATSECITAIDSDVLKQLSNAGMSVGRQISTELPKVDVRALPVTSERLKLTGEHAAKMAQVIVNLVRLAFKVSKDDESCTSKLEIKENGIELMRAVEQNKNLEKYLRVIVASAVVACRHKQSLSEEALMIAVSLAIENTLGEAVAEISTNAVIDTLHQFLRTPENFNQIILETINYLDMNETVQDRIEFALDENSEPTKVIKKLSKNLEGNMSETFQELLEKDESLLKVVLEQLKTVHEVSSENQVQDTVQKAIISAVKEKSKQTLKEMMTSSKAKSQAEIKDFQNLLQQSVALAKALGMYKVAATLLDVVSDSKSHEVLSNDATVMNILQRLTIMRQIAEVKPEFAAALKKLTNDPEAARSDPSMRELMRRSTALLVVPKKDLQSSADIPLSLVMSNNPLAVEEYLGETKRPRTLLIIKSGLQAVVPREAARAVLTGQVPYAVVDEKGIKYFEPLHVFSTMKLPKYAARCFSMYCCPEVNLGGNAFNTNIPNCKIAKAKEFKIIKRPNETIDQNHISYSIRRVVKSIKTGDESPLSLEKENIVEILSEEDSVADSKRLKLDLGDEKIDVLDNPAAKHKLSIRPKKRHGDPRQKTISSVSESTRCLISEDASFEGRVSPEVSHHRSNNDHEDKLVDVHCKREAVVKELLETEEEFGRDLTYVVDHYLKPSVSDGSSVPRIVRDNIDVIFSNFQQITNFHNTTLLEGIKYYSDEPRMLGKTFLRLERDFDKHTAYCRDEPLAQEFLAENPQVTEFFEELSQKLGDGKSISEYLKLPVQRINDYQVLLKDLVKYSDKLGENTYDLHRALELMLAIPQRANDNKFLSNIEGFHGNIHKLGRLLKHDWFSVVSEDKTSKERYLFLFKDHIIISKVKKISEDRSVFILKDLVPLSDVKIRDCSDDKTFSILLSDSGADNDCISIVARKENSKSSWLSEIKKHVPEVFNIKKKVIEEDDSKIRTELDEGKEQIDTLTSLPEKDSKQVSNEKSLELENNLLNKEKTGKEETMSRRLSTRRSYKAYEESYSVSSQREVYSHSSSATATSRFSSTSVYDSRIEASQNYESSAISSSSRAISSRSGSLRGSTKLSITSAEKPVFARTITGLNLEPGDTAVFECQLESNAQLTWLKDNKALDDKLADRVVRSSSDDGTHRLELQHVTELDSGTYTAMAQSDEGIATCTAHLMVHKISEEEKQRRLEANAPIFTVRLKDTELLTNTNFRFMVKVKGSPNPDVRFYKDGIPIRRRDEHIKLIDDKADIGFYELAISDVQPDHAGVYSCKASNEYGEAHCEGTITVTDHKTVFAGLENEILLTPGEKPTFTWVKDGKPFDPDERFKVLLGNEDDSLALIFQHVKPEDAGLYTCVASTTTGRISCSAELSVQGSVMPLSREPEKPKIEKEQKFCEATVGGSAMLEAKILGFPKPDVKWYHEGEEIKASGRFKFLYEDQETMTLVIKNVNPKDGGCYKIIAKNDLGEDITELSLTVKGAPKIVKKMEDIHVKIEETIKITVGIEGSPAPDIKWYKDGKELKETDRIKFSKSVNDEYTLTIKNANTSDAGSYSVVASNEINQCTDFCQVKVHSAPEILKKMEKNIDVSEGEEITFEIEVSSESAPKVKWMKDGVEMKSDERKTKITIKGDVYTLTILNADSKDSAEYSVEISNEYGISKDKGTATVSSKKCAPTFKKALKDTIAKEGETDVEFSVEVSAYPKPKIRWYLGETEITEKRKEYTKVEEDNSCKLILKKVTTELKGNYTCKIENDYGSAETTAKLTVHSKPIFVKQLQPKITVEEGAELTLEIECAGCPEPEITWFKDGQEVHTDAHIKITKDLHRSESYSMTLTLIQASDGGEYEAKASNCMGSATTKTYVQVFSKVTETTQEEVVQAVKQEPLEASQKAAILEEEGAQDKPTVQEPSKTKISFAETEWGGFKVEELDNSFAEEKPNMSQGIVEEALDSENISEHIYHKLQVNRGVSIVSLSEDDRTLSRNNSAIDFDNDDKNEFDKFDEEEEIRATGKKPNYDKENHQKGNEEAEQSDFWTSPAAEKPPAENENKPEDDFWASLADENETFIKKPSLKEKLDESDIKTSPVITSGKKFAEETSENKDNDFWASIADEKTHKNSEEIYQKTYPKVEESDYKSSSKTASEVQEIVDLNRPVESDLKTSPLDTTEVKTENEPEDDFWASLSNSNENKPSGIKETFFATDKIQVDKSENTAPTQIKQSHTEEPSQALETQPEEDDFWASLSDEKVSKLTKPWLEKAEENDYKTSSAEEKPILTKKTSRIDESQPDEGDIEALSKTNLPEEKAKQSDFGTSPKVAEISDNNDNDSSLDLINVKEKVLEEGKVEMFETPLNKPDFSKVENLDDSVKQKAEILTPKENGDIRKEEGPKKVPEPSDNTEQDSDGEDDPAVKALLSRIKKQRSVLEEILTKEAESRKEDAEVKLKPSFKMPLQDQKCSKKDVATFKCIVAANPEPEISWLLDGKEVKIDGVKIKSETIKKEVDETATEYTYTLKITEPEKADAGLYMIKAKNKYGFDESSASLTLQIPEDEKPEIKNLKDVTVNVDEDAIFEAEIISTLTLVITWLDKNGEKIKDGDRIVITEDTVKGIYKMIIKKTKMEDAGEYTLVASNDSGKTKQQVKLSVQETEVQQKPIFKELLKDQKCSKNDVATFKCVVAANPEPEITWLLNGKQLKVDGVKIKSDSSAKEVDKNATEYTYTLKITEPESADAGLYMIKAKNKYGFDESSASLTIQVEEDARPQIKNLKDVTIVPDEDATFEAEVISALSVVVTWLDKNGEKIKSGDKYVLTEDKVKKTYKLTIKSAKIEDVGEYTLVATNDSGERSQGAKLLVTGERPTIVKPIEDTRIKDGTDMDFLIRCNGIPKPDVEWFKDGKKLSNNEKITIKTQTEGQVSSSLSIEKFHAEDEGQYKVVAKNMVGSAENDFSLKLAQIPPVLEKGLPRSEEVDEGEVLELKCKLTGSPIPQVAWLKDGIPLEPSDRIKIIEQPDGLVKLSIENMKPADSGTYTVKAINPNGQITSNCAVAVQPKNCKPKILDGMKDAKAEVGKPLKLEAKIMCFPAPEIKWFKDGKPLRSSQTAVQSFNPDTGLIALEIKSVKPEDVGLYSVKITNKLGEAAQEAKVDVIKPQEKPKFEANMMPVSVVEGFPAKFDVKASGNPKPAIKWLHNGKEIVPDGEHITVKEEPDGTVSLLIDKVTPEDAGEYVAKAVNDQGEASSKADLSVLAKKTEKEEEAPSFIRPLSNVAIKEDDKLLLSAPIAGNPIPEVTWEKDGKPLLSDDRILLTCDGKKVNLEIKNCRPSDMGVYTCYLKNPLGEDKSKANVDVKKIYTEPVFLDKFKDTEQMQGTDAKFVARISGNPKPEAEWFFNGEPVTEGEKYQIKCEGDKYSLLVRNCNPEDRGLYRCSAFNRAGRADCVAQLNVVQKIETKQRAEAPSFLKKISDCDIYKGMTAKFTACVTGFPEPEFEWFRGDEKLQPSNRIKMEAQENGLIRLTILGVDDNDVGPYRLRIFNPHGEAECSASLVCDVLEPRTKKAVPDREERKERPTGGVPLPLTDKPIISRMTDRHLTLSWKPYIPPGPGAPVTYIVEMCKQPDGDWFTVRRGIRSCACDVRNLEPFQDYRFRIRVENKYGISDPSPYAETYRQKIIPDPPKFVPYLSPGIDFRPETSPYFPKDFDIERPPHDRYEQAPKFLRQEHEVQYGIKNQNSNLFWFVYGYPKPTMTYYFNDEPIEMGGRFESSYTRNGQATLFINKMLDRDVGVYEAVAKNEHGEARQRVRLEIAEYPVFIQRPEESYIMLRNSGQLTARIVGVPYPEIKWYKDWQPLAPSSRIKMQQIAPDTVTLTINDAILKDEGLYSVSATNVAGSVSSSAMVHIEEQEEAYRYATYGGGLNIRTRTEPHSNYYDIGDELGRGTQGITYHAVERRTGQNYAAKFMHGRSELKPFMLNELNIMNSLNHRKLIRLHDSFETKDLLVLVMELAGGGELLEWLIKQTYITEYEIADFIRQILWGLEYMHSNGYAHLSLTLNDLLLSRPDGDDIKICDFGLSRRITHGNLLGLNYGMPEFVAPEVVNGEGVSYSADMWSLGIITYILLSGFSPFKGLNDRETLTRIKEGSWKFEDFFSNISSEAKDFITKLLAYKPEERMDVKAALRHPWLERAGQSPPDAYKIKTDNLRSYHSSLQSWYKNANCRTWYRRQPLENAFTHPSKMVYPPAHDYTPEPETVPTRTTRQLNGRPIGDYAVPTREPLDYEVGDFKSESHYQYGPDTYLLQLRDVDLPCRLRHYMKVAADREQSYYSEPPEKHLDWRTPVIRERRKFTDIMDEEIDDERRQRISQYGSDDIYSLRRLKHEISCRSDGHAEAEAMLEYKREGHIPFFREKPQNLAIIQNQPAELSCLVVGDPDPVVQWFKNDLVMAESSRIKMRTDQNKRYYLKFEPALQADVGAYKVVARNKVGQTVARMRVVLATVPLSPDPPEMVEVSDTEVLLKWKQECDDVFTPVLCYSLQYKQSENDEWITVAKNIDQEFWLIKNLQPSTNYMFRLSSRNCAGWSAPGIPSAFQTKESGSSKVSLSDTQRQLQSLIESRSENDLTVEETKQHLDYSVEDAPLEWTADSNIDAKYNFTSEISRGQFSMVVKGVDKSSNQPVVAKIFEVNSNTEKSVAQEFDHFKSLRHERIAMLLAALRPAPNIAIFVMEKLQGADILSYFASRQEYNEDMLVTVFTQVLDGLQYLHWRGYCHLDIQPDNIVLASVKSLHIKLVDFGSVQKVSKLGTVVNGPFTEYSAPEILNNEPAFPQTDIWSLGTLIYVLLSGVSPFKADTEDETKQNITFVRYRFEHLYKEITQEATRFLMQIFKRTPSKRPTVEECYEARWFLSSEFMIKKRMKATFPGNRLKEYNEAYHNKKSGKGLALGELAKAFGEKVLRRSNSVQEELITF